MNQSPILVLFVGIPGSGKTTFARQLASRLDAVLLNSDGIRMAMWRNLDAIKKNHATPEQRAKGNLLTFGAMDYAAEQVVSAGYSVVYDCNANRVEERDEKHEIASRHNGISVVVRISVPYETSLQRIKERTPNNEQRQISEDIATETLDRFISEIEESTPKEHVINIPGDIAFDEQLALFQQGVNKFQHESTS